MAVGQRPAGVRGHRIDRPFCWKSLVEHLRQYVGSSSDGGYRSSAYRLLHAATSCPSSDRAGRAAGGVADRPAVAVV